MRVAIEYQTREVPHALQLTMSLETRLHDRAPARLECRQGAGLILGHQTAVTGDVSYEYRGEAALHQVWVSQLCAL